MEYDSDEFGTTANTVGTNNWMVINGPIQNPRLRKGRGQSTFDNSLITGNGDRSGNRIMRVGTSLLSFFQRSPYVLLIILVILYFSPLIFFLTAVIIVVCAKYSIFPK